MSVATAKVYWREAVEFVGYFVFMTTLGAAMVVLVRNAPQAHASWYIDTCIAVAAMTGAYAFRMYRRYRAARPAWTPVLTPVLDAEGGISPRNGDSETGPIASSPKSSARPARSASNCSRSSRRSRRPIARAAGRGARNRTDPRSRCARR